MADHLARYTSAVHLTTLTDGQPVDAAGRSQSSQSDVPLGPALDNPLEAGLVLLERDLPSRLIQIRVRLYKHLSRLLVFEHHVPHLGSPVLQSDARHVGEELGAGLDVGG